MQTTFSTIEDFIGTTITSEPYTISQERIVQFADATEDHQWIHIDEERAQAGPFGSTVAHGYLTLSLIVPLMQSTGLLPTDATAVINYGLNTLRFINPVKAGGSVSLKVTLAAVVERKHGQKLLTLQCEMLGENNETVLAADILFLLVP